MIQDTPTIKLSNDLGVCVWGGGGGVVCESKHPVSKILFVCAYYFTLSQCVTKCNLSLCLHRHFDINGRNG